MVRDAAVVLVQSLAWELLYAVGMAKKKKKSLDFTLENNEKPLGFKEKRGIMRFTFKKPSLGVPIHEDKGLVPGLYQWFKDPVLR